jgi:hypothetical protein
MIHTQTGPLIKAILVLFAFKPLYRAGFLWFCWRFSEFWCGGSDSGFAGTGCPRPFIFPRAVQHVLQGKEFRRAEFSGTDGQRY